MTHSLLPIQSLTNQTAQKVLLSNLFGDCDSETVMDFVEIEVITETNVIGIKPDEVSPLIDGQYVNGRAFPFENYQWYKIPDTYKSILKADIHSGIYSQNYLFIEYHGIYWIAERLR